jgi:putative endopeptidase
LRRIILVSFLTVLSCATAKKTEETVATAATTPTAAVQKFVADATKPMPVGLDEAAFDLAADPCTDFYQYACGGWMKNTEIPADKPLFSKGFVSIADRNEQYLKGILEEAAANKLPPGTPFAKQLGDYYASCMDETKLETALPELKKLVAQVTAMKSSDELAKSIGLMHLNGFGGLFNASPDQDLKDSNLVILSMGQGGLGLPDRDYYTDEDARKKTIREAYVVFLAQMFGMYGENAATAKKSADAAYAIELRLAKASLTRVEQRDPTKLYNRVEREGLKKLAPKFNWDAYLAATGAKDQQAINVDSTNFFKELGALAVDTKPEALKPYLTWHLIRGANAALPKKFQDAAFAFTAKHFSGAKEDRPRWKKCVAASDGDLGEALGQEFTRRYFPAESKARTSAMIEALNVAVEANLKTLTWMDETTRTAAFAKLKRMVGNNKIGFPNMWRDYSAIKTTRDSYLANSLAANRFEQARQMAKIGKPVDRNEWGMTPPTVNAYYNPQKNEIVFPAGILQPPFFNKDATDAVNFGGMGMVVGHEITHGFDDEGRQFDVDGNLKDWWTEKVGKDFVTKAECVKKQYGEYTAIDDIKLKGDLTLGENIADLGGLKMGHEAMKIWYAKKGGDDALRFTRSQQFFLGFAQSWCTKARPEMMRLRAATDPHSPPYWRVNGPVGNLAAFQSAFQCSNSSKMIRSGANACVVW